MTDILELPINGVLDLHTFQPSEVKLLVLDYLEACHEKGIVSVRIIHGKGIGNLRRSVHSILNKSPLVKNFELAGADAGHWGATIVILVNDEPMHA